MTTLDSDFHTKIPYLTSRGVKCLPVHFSLCISKTKRYGRALLGHCQGFRWLFIAI